MTERLYYSDSHMDTFTARVLSCEPAGEAWDVTLDRTAFFPEGGGQPSDTGTLGGVNVTHARESGDEVVHSCDSPLEVGGEAAGRIDWGARFRRMQDHSGEHIVSGLVHRLYGFENVGFHMDDSGMTVDFGGELTREQLADIERRANEVVVSNLPVRAWFPDADERETLKYRSKKDGFERLRLVEVEGCDLCACCAPHVSETGEVGLVKIISSMRHRGGMRVRLVCGLDALADYEKRFAATSAISNALSAKPYETAEAVERLKSALETAEYRLVGLRRQLVSARAASLRASEGDILLFESGLDADSARDLAGLGAPLAKGVCAVFAGTDGEWKYAVASQSGGLRELARELNAAVSGRGGGSETLIQGSASASRPDIEAYFRTDT